MMPEPQARSAIQKQPEPKIEARTAMKRLAGFTLIAGGRDIAHRARCRCGRSAGQVLAEIAERNCVLRLQRIRDWQLSLPPSKAQYKK